MKNYWLKKTIIAFCFIAIGFGLSSCDGSGCVAADEFNNKSVKVNSNPVQDGVFGSYDDLDGGQVAAWHETGLRTSNEDFIILISGAWVPWKGTLMTPNKLDEMDRCNFCAKKENVATRNCICYNNQRPEPEIGIGGNVISNVNCDGSDQNNPDLCTCTKNEGFATDYGAFHFPLNYYKKDYSRKLPDDQTAACKYDRGMGLYLGVFGRSSNETPKRIYHLFSEVELCPIAKNSDGYCIDDEGRDRTKYVFRSRNERTFVEDDLSGNDGTDKNPDDDEYHKANEFIKLIIYDRYYSDNYGQYNIDFVKGVVDDGDIGLIEFIVRTVEDAVLGDLNLDGEREGGVIEFMYKAITKDFGFMILFQLLLVLYITIFGLASLMGVIEMNQKEIYSRVIKISVVIFFVNPDSWYFYREIVVGFFKDGMEVIIDIITDIALNDIDTENNPIALAQAASSTPGSEGSRFAYVDALLRTLLSDNVTKKIWGLFFADIFGLLYIAAIYALILYFLYTMLIAAAVYAITLMKLIFALSLGPIFISFALFKQTNEYFKNWISFMGARSIEIIILFMLLYILLGLIGQRFNELLYYPVCYEYLAKGFFNIKILQSNVNRGLVEWFSMIVVLAIFIYLTQMIMAQIPNLAGALISIGGVGNQSSGGANSASGFGLAQRMVGEFADLSKKVAGSAAKNGLGGTFRSLRFASRKSGISGAFDRAANKIPVRGIRTRLRDGIVKSALKQARMEADKLGLKGAAYDAKVRDLALNDKQFGIHAYAHKNPNKAALYDLDTNKAVSRLDKLLIKDPLKKHIKEQAKKMRQNDDFRLLGKDFEKALKEDARKWADKNLAGGSESIEGYLKNMNSLISSKASYSSGEAAKKFGGDDKNRNIYAKHLKDRQIDKDSKKGISFNKFSRKVRGKDEASRPDGLRGFLRKSDNKEKGLWGRATFESTGYGLSAAKRKRLEDEKSARMMKSARDYLQNGSKKDLDKINEHYDNKVQGMDKRTVEYRDAERERLKELQELADRKMAYRKSLDNEIARKARDALKDADEEQKAQLIADAKKRLADLEEKSNGISDPEQKAFTDFDGDNLFEANSWNNHLSGEKETLASDSNIGNSSDGIGDGNGEGASAALMQESEISAGEDISEAFALKGDIANILTPNVSVGSGGSDGKIIDHSIIASVESRKSQFKSKVMASKHDLAFAEKELSDLKALGENADQSRISKLEGEISSHQEKIRDGENQLRVAENQLAELNHVKNN